MFKERGKERKGGKIIRFLSRPVLKILFALCVYKRAAAGAPTTVTNQQRQCSQRWRHQERRRRSERSWNLEETLTSFKLLNHRSRSTDQGRQICFSVISNLQSKESLLQLFLVSLCPKLTSCKVINTDEYYGNSHCWLTSTFNWWPPKSFSTLIKVDWSGESYHFTYLSAVLIMNHLHFVCVCLLISEMRHRWSDYSKRCPLHWNRL